MPLRKQDGDGRQGREERLQAASYLFTAAALRFKRSDGKAGNNSHMPELYSNFAANTCLDDISSYSIGGIKLYQLKSADAI